MTLLSNPVVLVTPTIMDGKVVRWYNSEAAALNGAVLVSASRKGVDVRVGLMTPEEVPVLAELLDKAAMVVAKLRRGEDVSHLATHTRPFLGELEPVGGDANAPDR